MTRRILGAVALTLVLTPSLVLAGPTSYTFVTVDITVPDRPGVVAIPKDINDDGMIVSNIFSTAWGPEALVANPTKRQRAPYETQPFTCAGVPFADTTAFAINDKFDVVGYCTPEQNGSTTSGFVRDRNGKRTLLNAPGANLTYAFGISSDRQVVGQYYTPLETGATGLARIHGFTWSAGKFNTIDFPMADTYTALWSANRAGRIIGEYYRYNPATNATLEHNWFVYDNGQFKLEFPPSLEWMGGPAVLLADMNDGGQIVGMRYNGGSAWNGIFVYEDGVVSNVTLPEEYLAADVRGMNNKGQFVGAYLKQVGVDTRGEPIFELHGYIATPESK